MSGCSQNPPSRGDSQAGSHADEEVEIIDLGHLRQLESLRVAGKRSLFFELSTLFCSEMPPRLEKLGAMVRQRDAAAVAKLAHAIVGSAATVGGRKLQSELRALEVAVESGDWPRIEGKHRAVIDAWDALQAAIKKRQETSA